MEFLIRYRGLFDYEGLYQQIRNWLTDRRYEFHEKRYKDKPMTYGREIELEWWAQRPVDEWVRYKITVSWHIWDGQEKIIEEAGRKKKLMQGRILLTLGYELETDWAGIMKEGDGWYGKLKGHCKKVIDTVRKNEIGVKYEDALHYDTLRLHTEIKKFLNMYTKVSAY